MSSQVTLGIFRVSSKVCCKKLIVFCYLLYQPKGQFLHNAMTNISINSQSAASFIYVVQFLPWPSLSILPLSQPVSTKCLTDISDRSYSGIFTANYFRFISFIVAHSFYIFFFVRALSLSLARENVLVVESTWIVIRGHAVWKSISDKRPDCYLF